MNKLSAMMLSAGLLAAAAIFALALKSDRTEHVEALARRIDALEQRVAGLDVKSVDADPAAGPATVADGAGAERTTNEPDPPEPQTIQPEVMARLQHVEHTVAETDRTLSETIDERVAEVVDEKISKLEMKRNMKPPLADFVEVLELDENQVSPVEDVIWLGQDAIRTILEIPTADGRVLIDGLVEALAYGGAQHPEAGRFFMEWVGQVMSTPIPGSDDTYGLRIEAAKNDVREALRRELTDEQYAEFERWNLDPTEVQEIQDSPWIDIGERVELRARELTP